MNEHQHDFNKLIADIQKRQRGKKNKSATKTTGQYIICFCCMNCVCFKHNSQLFENIIFCYITTKGNFRIKGIVYSSTPPNSQQNNIDTSLLQPIYSGLNKHSVGFFLFKNPFNTCKARCLWSVGDCRASSVPIFPIFPIFFDFPYIFLFNSKTPYNPYNVRIKRKKSIFVESCKTDSAQLAFLLFMEPVFKKFPLKSLMDRLLKSQVLKETEGKHLLIVEYSKSDNLLSNSQIEGLV